MSQSIEAHNDWTKALNENLCVDIIYFDSIKAFDSVSHKKLLEKLSLHGIGNPLLLWLENFLTYRTYSVKINDKFSNISEAKTIPYKPCYSDLLTISNKIFEIRPLINDIICYHKILHGCIKLDKPHFPNINSTNRKNKIQIQIDISSLNLRHHLFLDRMARLYPSSLMTF